MLIFTPRYVTAVFFARMVMPFSRSSSFESMARSTMASLARKMPVWRSMKSTSVVFPWSTCAMIAMLRMSWRMVTKNSLPDAEAAAWPFERSAP